MYRVSIELLVPIYQVLSRLPFFRLAALLTFYCVIDSRDAVYPYDKMAAASWHFRSVCEEDFRLIFERRVD